MKVHHGGKNGDLVYALPVIKALARERGEKVTIVTSPLCFQIVPLLWEQPYIQDVEMDARPYRIDERGNMDPWQVLSPEEGINLSPQPAMYRPNAPIQWTYAYAEIAGVKELRPKDKIALPTLWNHRQWYWEHVLTTAGKDKVSRQWMPPKIAVLAPESETLKTIPLDYWRKVADKLGKSYRVLVVGTKPDLVFQKSGAIDLRGLTTVSSMARLLAEAYVVISANSLPWHLARHSGTPTFCFQDQYLDRCTPMDTPYAFYTASQWELMAGDALRFAEDPKTTLMSDQALRELVA